MAGDRSSTRKRWLIKNGHKRCFWCGIRLGPYTLTCDHLIPVSKGGSHKRTNLVAACKPCNQHRGNMDANDYRRAFPKGAPHDFRRHLSINLLTPREALRIRIEKAKARKAKREASGT